MVPCSAPCIQAIFRAYRFGQTKTVYVYRLVAEGTMEAKIYQRQMTKQGMSLRVLDEHQAENAFSLAELQVSPACLPAAEQLTALPSGPLVLPRRGGP